jgi:rhodanese-related sulfurtransferase
MSNNHSSNINAAEMAVRIQNNEVMNLLDVREVIEYHTFNIGGVNIPLSALSAAIPGLAYNKADEIIVVCKVGLRSETAQSILQQNGYTNVRNLTGGLMALQKLR